MYKQLKTIDDSLANCISRISDGAAIPFDPANTDYQRFKIGILEGSELKDADGNVMSAEAAVAFISNLP